MASNQTNEATRSQSISSSQATRKPNLTAHASKMLAALAAIPATARGFAVPVKPVIVATFGDDACGLGLSLGFRTLAELRNKGAIYYCNIHNLARPL